MADDWSEAELRASVEAYLDMLHKELKTQRFVKRTYYENLAQRFNRSAKALEYRMQNISYVRSLLGRPWVSGLKPAKNVGAHVAARIEALIADTEGQSRPSEAAFEVEVRELQKRPLSKPPGSVSPLKTNTPITQFVRDPAVKAWVLQQAKGRCECCMQPAPFQDAEGAPFLEVHHVRPLADGGADTPGNAVAVCPNCHRELHYGQNRQTLLGRMWERIERLDIGDDA